MSSFHKALNVSITYDLEPKSHEKTYKDENWQRTMSCELKALAINDTWKLVDLPPNVKLIGSIRVYKTKHKSDDCIERYKARLVAKGYSKVEELGLFDTFSLVENLCTLIVLLVVASIKI